MKILENHFRGKTTYVVGSYISNGCQTFHVDEAKEVFDEFKVPVEMQQEVLSYVYKDEDLTSYINHEDCRVRVLVAKQGYGLDILTNDENWYVRYGVATQGYGLDVLFKDKDCCVRLEVAKQGYGLDVLIKDENWLVRQEAEFQLKLLKK